MNDINIIELTSLPKQTDKCNLNCCICLDSFDINNTNIEKEEKFVKLYCCNQCIHKNCVLDWMLSTSNKHLQCPMCRTSIEYFNTIIQMNDFLAYVQNNYNIYEIITDNNNHNNKKITSKKQLSKLINLLYGSSEMIIRVDSNVGRHSDPTYTLLAYIFIFFLMLPIIFVIAFLIIHFIYLE